MNAVKRHLQHLFNPLHLYCRLREAGLPLSAARGLCRAYERCLYRMFSH